MAGLVLIATTLVLSSCVTRLPEELDRPPINGGTTDHSSSEPSDSTEVPTDTGGARPEAGTGGGDADASWEADAGDASFEGGSDLAPELVTTNPADGATGVSPDVLVTLEFDVPVQPGEGSVSLYRTSDDSLVETLDISHARVTFVQSSVMLDWEATLATAAQYYVVLESGAVLSAAGVPYGGFSDELSFTTEQPPPLVVTGKSPVNEAEDVDPNTKLALTFNEMIRAGSGDFSLYAWDEQEDDSELVEAFDVGADNVLISDSTLTLEPSSSLNYSTRYFVLAEEGVVSSLMGAPFEGIAGSSAWTFVTADAAPPPLVLEQLEPEDGETGVAIDATIALTFDQPIRSGSGTITVYLEDTGEPVESAEVTDPRVTVSANRAEFDPDADFDYATGYYVLISAGAFESRDGASFVGITNPSDFSFTTTGTLPSCDGDEVMREGTRDCYLLVASATSWSAARETCEDRGEGWDLVAIRSPQEQQFVEGLIDTETWIGATDAQQDGDWRWVRDDSAFWSGNRDGQAIDGAYVRWLTDEPSGGTNPPEHCARMVNKGSGWYWADVSCDNSYQFVCQGPAD